MQLRAFTVFAVVLCLCPIVWGQITPFLVEDSGGNQLGPDVAGLVVVWSEFMNGDFVVRGKDLGSGNVFLIDGPNVGELEPVTNGSLVAWRDKRTGDFNIYAQDLQSGQQWTVVGAPFNQTQPAMSENYIVWSDRRSSTNLDIYALDLRTRQEFPVCTAVGSQQGAAVSGNIIVWQDPRRPSPNPLVADIYGYNVTTGKEFVIAASPDGVPQSGPAISGNIVVWVDGHNGGDIRGYDLASATSFPIHVESPDDYHGQSQPDIDGHYVVWVDGRDGPSVGIWSIMGYDLLTGREFTIFQGPGYNWGPKVNGDLVVWYTDIAGQPSRIMAAYIPEPASVVLLGLGGALLAGRRRRR